MGVQAEAWSGLNKSSAADEFYGGAGALARLFRGGMKLVLVIVTLLVLVSRRIDHDQEYESRARKNRSAARVFAA